jgi:phosphoserine phosphatase RsbU/P
MPTRKQAKRILYAVLIVLCLVTLLIRVRTTWRITAQLTGHRVTYQVPVTLEAPRAEIRAVRDEALAAGLRPGDRILTVNGKIFDGYFDLLPEGPDIHIAVDRRGQEHEFAFELTPRSLRNEAFGERTLVVVLGLVMPWLCLVLGFWAAFVRPLDSQAWLLLLLMITFPHMVVADLGGSTALVRVATLVFHETMRAALPVAMVLFGIYFAERLVLDVRYPWLKWVLLGPMALVGLIHVPAQAFYMEKLFAAQGLIELDLPLQQAGFWLLFASIAVFFVCTGAKVGMTDSKDARRRLLLLLWGTQIAMAPSFFMLIVRVMTGQSLEETFPGWAIVGSLLMIFLFPATITYVVVVHRALDIRVVIRQSIQYALARGGAAILFLLLGAAVLAYSINLALQADLRRTWQIAMIGAGVGFIFALQLVRQRVAAWVDQRFFRQAYDAERVLTDLSEEVRTLVDVNALLKTVTDKISQTLFVPRVAFLVANGSRFQTAYATGFNGQPPVDFPESAGMVRELRGLSHPAKVYLDDEDSWVYRSPDITEEERERLRRLDSQLILPVAVREQLLGFISLGQKLSEEPYSGSDLRLLRTLAAQTGLALENTRLTAAVAAEAAHRERIAREVEIAREVQERLFPQKPPQLEGVCVAGACRPAQGVAGDYYDYFELSGGRLGFAVADVSGKGISAALLMASLQALIRSQAIREPEDLAELIGQVNSLLYESSASHRYATLFYGQIDPQAARLDYVNAGHNPPLLLRATSGDFDVQRLEKGGTVVGLLPQSKFEQGSVVLQSGDLILGFTDGISEAMNRHDEEWGEERMVEAVKSAGDRSPRALIQHLMEAADRFVDGAPQNDDMTLVVVRLK